MTASSAHWSAGRVPLDWQQRQIVFPLHPVEARQQRIDDGGRQLFERAQVCALGW
jgi:hypothetical protein